MRINCGSSWSIETAGWAFEQDESCFTLTPGDYDAAFQISTYRKKTGSVTDDDLMRPWGVSFPLPNETPASLNIGEYDGVYSEFEFEGNHWRVWSLRRDNVNIFLTFVTQPEYAEYYRTIVDWMVSSLENPETTREM